MDKATDFTLTDLLEEFCHAFSVEDDGKLALRNEFESSMWVRITMGTTNSGWAYGHFPTRERLKFRTTMKIHASAPGKIVLEDENLNLYAISVKDMFRYFPDLPIDPLFLRRKEHSRSL